MEPLPAALRGPAATFRDWSRSAPAGAGGRGAFGPAGLAELSGLSDLVARRRGFNVIEHRQPRPRPGVQPGGDRRVRRWLTAGPNTSTQSLITCPGW